MQYRLADGRDLSASAETGLLWRQFGTLAQPTALAARPETETLTFLWGEASCFLREVGNHELVVCSAGRAVVHTYVGDFMGLCDEWRLLWESLQADGICPRGEPREHYETSPEEVNDPAEHVTRLVWPLGPKEE